MWHGQEALVESIGGYLSLLGSLDSFLGVLQVGGFMAGRLSVVGAAPGNRTTQAGEHTHVRQDRTFDSAKLGSSVFLPGYISQCLHTNLTPIVVTVHSRLPCSPSARGA